MKEEGSRLGKDLAVDIDRKGHHNPAAACLVAEGIRLAVEASSPVVEGSHPGHHPAEDNLADPSAAAAGIDQVDKPFYKITTLKSIEMIS